MMLDERNARAQDSLHLVLWNGCLTVGQVNINLSLTRRDERARYQPLSQVANRMAVLREERGMSRWECARILNISQGTLKALEQGNYIPSLELALCISTLLDLSIEEIFSYT